MSRKLFSPFDLGGIELKNRIVMAPMTRCRATGNVPNGMMAEYYSARAGAGLLITEGTAPSPNGLGYARIPGIFLPEQVEGWRGVTDAVHAAGGRIFVQLMHTGRVSHPDNMPDGTRVVAPSAVVAPDTMWTDGGGMQAFPEPEVMTGDDIELAVAEFVQASRNAIEAGFDGVELHGANGYLIDQFLNTASNRRDDRWGGSVPNRIRFAVEVAQACAATIGADRLGMRLSPYGVFNGQQPDDEMDALYEMLADELGAIGLAYIHIVDHSAMGAPEVSPALKASLRERFDGSYILSGGYDAETAEADLQADRGDLVAFGRPFISNPDLPARFADGAGLTDPDPDTFYTPGEAGYLGY